MAFSRRSRRHRATAFLGLIALPLAAQKFTGPLQPLFAGAYGGGMHTGGQGYLGVGLRSVSDPSVSSLHLKDTHGVVVTMVDHDGPAFKAGIREHDVILSVNGTPADTEDQLRHLLREMHPGKAVQIAISRDGTQQTLSATLANSDEIGRQAWEQHWVVPAPVDSVAEDTAQPAAASRQPRGFAHGFVGGHLLPWSGAYTGVMVNEIEPQLAEYFGLKNCKGLLVQSVDQNSPAAAAGLHAGDIVTRLNGTAVETRSDWTKALHDSKGHPVSVTVMREHHEQVLVMTPDAKRRSSLEEPAEHPDRPRWIAVLLTRSSSL